MDPNVGKWCLIYILGGAGFLFWKPTWEQTCFILVGMYAGLSLLWSPVPLQGFLYLINILACLGCFIFFQRFDVPVEPVVLAAIIASLIVPLGGFGNENWQAEFLLLCVPFLVSKRCAVLLVCIVSILILNPSDTKWAVLLLAVGWGIVWLWKRKQFGLALITVLIPGNVVLWRWETISFSILERLELWINTLRVWWEAPIFGNGLGSFDYLYPKFQEFHTQFFGDTLLRDASMIAGQSHNEFVQVLSALGIVGLGLCLSLLLLVRRDDAQARWCLAIAGVIACVGFPLQTPATALVIVYALARLVPSTVVSEPFSFGVFRYRVFG